MTTATLLALSKLSCEDLADTLTHATRLVGEAVEACGLLLKYSEGCADASEGAREVARVLASEQRQRAVDALCTAWHEIDSDAGDDPAFGPLVDALRGAEADLHEAYAALGWGSAAPTTAA